MIEGAITPLVTPFADDGELDLAAIKPLDDWQLTQGTHGISVGGSTGEPTSQTIAERIAVMRAAVEAIDGRVPFLPGTGSARMDETLELTAEAQRLGAAAALVVTPLSGIELLCYPMLCLGGDGHLSCVGNFAPRPVAELYDAFAAGDYARARALHYDLHPLVDAAFCETNPVPAKWLMHRLGLLPSAHARVPLAPLSEASQRRGLELVGRSPHVTLDAEAVQPA